MHRLAANLSFLYKEVAFLDRFSAASRAGFAAVEFMFPGDNGYHHSVLDVRAQLEANDLQQVLLNSPSGDWSSGERGIGGLPDRQEEWEASINVGLTFAKELNCPRMHVMSGLVQHGACEDTFVKRLRKATSVASSAGVCLCIEPLNHHDFPGYLVGDIDTALRILERVNRPDCCRLQLDLYHVARIDPTADLALRVTQLLPVIEHIQFANPPGRNEPGVGSVAFDPLLALLNRLSYDGFVGLEYKPSRCTESSLAWAAAYGLNPLNVQEKRPTSMLM
mmetsp:Transcript_14976/g.25015  ORF Transcript_14976/g.25015 Transcript_14976/m.25015 type:complete len:278 (+) Transcript_14976:45-878(+)